METLQLEWQVADPTGSYDLQRWLNELSYGGWTVHSIHWVQEPQYDKQFAPFSHWTVVAYRERTTT